MAAGFFMAGKVSMSKRASYIQIFLRHSPSNVCGPVSVVFIQIEQLAERLIDINEDKN
jgi:hypothetical protein